MSDSTQLDRLFHALSDPTRRAFVERLTRGPASVKELARPHSMALPSVLKHLHVLESGGIVASRKAGRVRTFQIDPVALSRVEQWVAERKKAWNGRFDRLEHFLQGKS